MLKMNSNYSWQSKCIFKGKLFPELTRTPRQAKTMVSGTVIISNLVGSDDIVNGAGYLSFLSLASSTSHVPYLPFSFSRPNHTRFEYIHRQLLPGHLWRQLCKLTFFFVYDSCFKEAGTNSWLSLHRNMDMQITWRYPRGPL